MCRKSNIVITILQACEKSQKDNLWGFSQNSYIKNGAAVLKPQSIGFVLLKHELAFNLKSFEIFLV